ncbi:MAG: hypothetical protein OXN89_09515 [Bryobacterales bacterium]|nr:hypothetical protein [Bryobacterales bacterium]
MADFALSCSRCGHPVRLLGREKIQRKDTCNSCGADLHACVHCRHFAPARSNQCAEPQAEWVRDKKASNFCGYFAPRASVNLTARGGRNPAADARAAFHALFKN